MNKQPGHGNQILWLAAYHQFDLRLRTAAGQRYVYLAIMYSSYVGVAEYIVNTGLAVDVVPR
ncbi:hypothetical protein OW715_14620 [Acidithiobacillus ferriphilus]|nr:hypothetical protein [Acidithiobacillus ferriphilus]